MSDENKRLTEAIAAEHAEARAFFAGSDEQRIRTETREQVAREIEAVYAEVIHGYQEPLFIEAANIARNGRAPLDPQISSPLAEAAAWEEGWNTGVEFVVQAERPEQQAKHDFDTNPFRVPVVHRVHNHGPWRPMCNERDVDGQLRGACLNDDGSTRAAETREATA